MSSTRLISHWPLVTDARDAAGDAHGNPSDVTFGVTAGGRRGTAFNGGSSVIRIPDSGAVRLGNRDFSLVARVCPEYPMRGLYGDILAKFDTERRCGLVLRMAGSSTAYSSMGDSRHISFCIDDGSVGHWEDCGRPWESNSLIAGMVVHDGELYCGIADAARPQDAAHVFRWHDSDRWEDCGRLGGDPNRLSAMSMITHSGGLYAGTGIWDWDRARGDAAGFPPAAPTRVFQYEGDTRWRDLGQVGDGSRVLCLASFEGQLYAGLDNYGGGRCFRYDGSAWQDCGAPDARNLECMIPLAGTLYAATHGNFYVYEGGERWRCIGREPHEINQVHSLQVYGGALYAGTWPQGYVLRYEGQDRWTIAGRLGLPEGLRECNEINDLVVYNGKLYAGTIPKAQVYRYESDGQWTLLRSLASRPDWAPDDVDSWCRVTAFAPHAGRLFAGTGSCFGRSGDVDPEKTLGRVYAYRAGQAVSHQAEEASEWLHVAAVRQGRNLSLYVNGQISDTSTLTDPGEMNLTNVEPITIGSGPGSSFFGTLADVRLYEGALAPDEVLP